MMQPHLEEKLRQNITLACQNVTEETLSRVPQNLLEELLLCINVEGRDVEHILQL